MMLLLGNVVRSVARVAGFVPIAEMRAKLAEKDAQLATTDGVEKEFRHAQRNLEHQLVLQDRMDREIAFLRELQLAHLKEDSDTQRAVSKIEAIADQLQAMMQDTWPAAITEEPAAPTAR